MCTNNICFYIESQKNMYVSFDMPIMKFSAVLSLKCTRIGTNFTKISSDHYENTPIQIYRKFHLQKLKIFR